MKRPNIIIVMTDQQRYDLRKSQGYCLDTMPFLDSWAELGVDFANAYTSNPTCMPARVSLFTGRYPSAHKVRTNHNEEDALYTRDLLDIVKEEGYRTALCGKNHSHHRNSEFDFVEENGHLGYEGEENTTKEELEFADFLVQTKHMEADSPSPGSVKVQHPYRNVSSCLQFIDSLDKDVPFFAWVSFAEPHNPYQVPAPYFDLFPPKDLPQPLGTADDLPLKGKRFEWLRDVWEKVLGDEIDQRIKRCRSNYHGMLRLIDDQFKRLIMGLRERELEDHTIVIYLSDHGDFAGEYGLIRKGVDLPEVLTHIPMIWKGPQIAAVGKQKQYFANIVDVFPTICDMIGVDIPFGCQGKSMKPILENKAIPEKEFETAYSETGFSGRYWNSEDKLTLKEEGASPDFTRFDCLNTWTQCGQVRMLRKDNYKIQVDMMGQGYLYDLAADPVEAHNLWEEASMVNIRADMLAELTAAILRTQDVLPAPHRRYRTKVHEKGYWFEDYCAEDPGIREDELPAKCCNHQNRLLK